MPPYPKRKKYLSISSKELEELRKEYAKDDSLLVWMQRQRKWLWLLYAVLVLLFAAGVIFPKVDFRISDEVIRLDRTCLLLNNISVYMLWLWLMRTQRQFNF